MSHIPLPISDQPVLKLVQVEHRYGLRPILGGVSMQVRRGEIAAVLGTSGAGKTTLLQIISGMRTPHAGTVIFKGEEITGADPSLIVAQGLSHVSEGRAVFAHLSTHDNLRMGAYTRTDVHGVAKDMEAVYRYFPVLRAQATRAAGELLPQQQLMLAMACALMANPDLLLLDAPSADLPQPLAQEIWELVVRINRERGTTILMTEDSTSAALSVADYGYVLDKGRITQEGSSATLRERMKFEATGSPARRLHETM